MAILLLTTGILLMKACASQQLIRW